MIIFKINNVLWFKIEAPKIKYQIPKHKFQSKI